MFWSRCITCTKWVFTISLSSLVTKRRILEFTNILTSLQLFLINLILLRRFKSRSVSPITHNPKMHNLVRQALLTVFKSLLWDSDWCLSCWLFSSTQGLGPLGIWQCLGSSRSIMSWYQVHWNYHNNFSCEFVVIIQCISYQAPPQKYNTQTTPTLRG